jgi:hypothetical protein
VNDDFTDGLILGTLLSTPTPVVQAKTFWGSVALSAVIGAIQGAVIAVGIFFTETLVEFIVGGITAIIDGIGNN